MMDELDLGLPPKRPKKVTPPSEGVSWAKHAVVNRRMCDECIRKTPTINGVPIHSIERAYFERKEGSERSFWCAVHAAIKREGEEQDE